MSDPTLIKHETVCNLCPQDKPFRVMTSAVPIIGADPKKLVASVIQEVAKHLAKKHPEALEQIQLRAAEFMMFAGAQFFRSSDPIITEAQNLARYRIRKSTERIVLPDDKIEEKAKALSAGEHLDSYIPVESVIAWVKEIRDALLEQGPFCPEPVSVPASASGNGYQPK